MEMKVKSSKMTYTSSSYQFLQISVMYYTVSHKNTHGCSFVVITLTLCTYVLVLISRPYIISSLLYFYLSTFFSTYVIIGQ